MSVITKNEKWTGGFVISMANGELSLQEVTLDATAAHSYRVGQVLSYLTATPGVYVPWDEDDVAGLEIPQGIVYGESVGDTVEVAITVDKQAVLVRRYAEVNAGDLIWSATATAGEIATASALFENLGIIVRNIAPAS